MPRVRSSGLGLAFCKLVDRGARRPHLGAQHGRRRKHIPRAHPRMKRPTVYIETYGCQMNVSDTELMLGKLAATGYDAGGQSGRRRRHSRQHLRDPRSRRAARDRPLGELKRHMKPSTVDGRHRLHGAAARPDAAREDAARELVVGPDGYRALPALDRERAARASARRRSISSKEHYEDFTAEALRQGEGVDSGAARLRLSVHVLHRAVHARPGAQPRARRRRARSRAASSPRG